MGCTASAEEDNLSPFDSNNVCLCQSIEINNSKHVYRQSQVQNQLTGSGVEWAECSLTIGTGWWVQVFSLILDSSVSLASGHSGCWRFGVWDPGFESCIQQRKTTWLDSNIVCLCQSIEINNNKYNKTKLNKTICIFYGMYCVCSNDSIRSQRSLLLTWSAFDASPITKLFMILVSRAHRPATIPWAIILEPYNLATSLQVVWN